MSFGWLIFPSPFLIRPWILFLYKYLILGSNGLLGSTFKGLISKHERITIARKYADINLDLENKKRFLWKANRTVSWRNQIRWPAAGVENEDGTSCDQYGYDILSVAVF